MLSWLTYRYVEQPARNSRWRIPPAKVFAVAGGAIVGMALLGISVRFLDGIPQRLRPEVAGLNAAAEELNPFQVKCVIKSLAMLRSEGPCILGDAQADKLTILWGDSHAAALMPALDKIGREAGMRVAVFARGHCAPISGLVPPYNELVMFKICSKSNKFVQDYIKANRPEFVLMAAVWSQYRLPLEFSRNIASTLNVLSESNTQAFLFLEVPSYSGGPKAWARQAVSGRISKQDISNLSTMPVNLHRQETKAVAEVLKSHFGTRVIDPADFLCRRDGVCRMFEGATWYYVDGQHLSLAGAVAVSPLLANAFSF
ncbi:MAG: hypothetical protein HOM07_02950 [Rhodospirillaceae bacterium]|nr:hypothetical protein [Rhodospirillaceae bacterium]MBT5191279.1 hypothetical protein [Rhodospirillaceae bacterium]MBT5456278.1 hypothetical protein [Rhodospirillaceae bacterium]